MKLSEWIGSDSPVSADKAGRLTFSILLLLLAFRWYAGRFTFELAGAPIMNPELDNTFWAILATGIPAWIVSNEALCMVLDIMVVAIALWAYRQPFDRRPLISFIVLFFIQTIINEAYTSQHSKTVVCIYIGLIPFLYKGGIWLRLWEFSRYYLGFVMVVSAYFKFVNGGLLQSDHFTYTLVHQHADILTMQSSGWQSTFIHWLIQQKALNNILFWILFFVQLSFAVLFFTKRFDRFLVLMLFTFCCMSYILMRIYNFDLIILAAPLWYSSVIEPGLKFAFYNKVN